MHASYMYVVMVICKLSLRFKLIFMFDTYCFVYVYYVLIHIFTSLV